MIKVCTTKNTGKYVRLFTFLISFTLVLVSCEIQNDNDSNDARDNITGTWKCKELDKDNTPNSFEATISKNNSDSTKIWVDNFSAFGPGIKVSVGMGGHLLTIPIQTVDGFKISGSGSVASSNNKIDWTYSIDDDNNGVFEHFTATFTR